MKRTVTLMLSTLFVFAIQAETRRGGLVVTIQKAGSGAVARKGQTVKVHYTGWLKSNKKEFDSSRTRNVPFEFKLGQGQVIQGWDIGVEGMKVGEKRQLIIPAAMGYGAQGAGGVIPPNSDLIFDVELLGVR